MTVDEVISISDDWASLTEKEKCQRCVDLSGDHNSPMWYVKDELGCSDEGYSRECSLVISTSNRFTNEFYEAVITPNVVRAVRVLGEKQLVDLANITEKRSRLLNLISASK